jgi:hypothetical protein
MDNLEVLSGIRPVNLIYCIVTVSIVAVVSLSQYSIVTVSISQAFRASADPTNEGFVERMLTKTKDGRILGVEKGFL